MFFVVFVVVFVFFAVLFDSGTPLRGAQHVPVFRGGIDLVNLGVTVTDKKGNYINDLAQKDFKVWEDDKEQAITSFSGEAGQGPGNNDQKRYLVLFFDNSTMDMTDSWASITPAPGCHSTSVSKAI